MTYTSKHPHTKELRDPAVTANMLLALRDKLYEESVGKGWFAFESVAKINSCLYVSDREQRDKKLKLET